MSASSSAVANVQIAQNKLNPDGASTAAPPTNHEARNSAGNDATTTDPKGALPRSRTETGDTTEYPSSDSPTSGEGSTTPDTNTSRGETTNTATTAQTTSTPTTSKTATTKTAPVKNTKPSPQPKQQLIKERRILTKPSEPSSNNGQDNANGDLIVRVQDVLYDEQRRDKYHVDGSLGEGAYGVVCRCTKRTLSSSSSSSSSSTSSTASPPPSYAVKIIKNRPAYYNAAMNEIRVLQVIQARLGSKCKSIILLETSFLHQSHLCLVFEVLGINLYEMLKKNQFRGLSMDYLRAILTQLIEATRQLHSLQIIHCDLKPENILLKVSSSEPSHQRNAASTTTNSSLSSSSTATTNNPKTTNQHPNKDLPEIKVIDLGSACFDGQTIYPYIQSRFYRAPEVVLGVPYDNAIDMWSIGCIAAELFVGLPIFPGVSEHAQLARIMDMFQDYPPLWMLTSGRATHKMFDQRTVPTSDSREKESKVPPYAVPYASPGKKMKDTTTSSPRWSTLGTPPGHVRQRGPKQGTTVEHPYVFKTPTQYQTSSGRKKVDEYKTYFRYSSLEDIILFYSMPKNLHSTDIQKIRRKRYLLVDLLTRLLRVDPTQRITAAQALEHPFLTGKALEDADGNAVTVVNQVASAVKQWVPSKDLTLIMRQRSHQKEINRCEREEFKDVVENSPDNDSSNSNSDSSTAPKKGSYRTSAPRRISTTSNNNGSNHGPDFSSSLPNYVSTSPSSPKLFARLSGQWSPGTSFLTTKPQMMPPPLTLSASQNTNPLYPPHIQPPPHQPPQQPPQPNQQQQPLLQQSPPSFASPHLLPFTSPGYRTALNANNRDPQHRPPFWDQQRTNNNDASLNYLSPGPPDAFPSNQRQIYSGNNVPPQQRSRQQHFQPQHPQHQQQQYQQHHHQYQQHQQHQQQQQQQRRHRHRQHQRMGSGGSSFTTQRTSPPMSTSMGSLNGLNGYAFPHLLTSIRETSTESHGSALSSNGGSDSNRILLPEESRRAQLAIGEIQRKMARTSVNNNNNCNYNNNNYNTNYNNGGGMGMGGGIGGALAGGNTQLLRQRGATLDSSELESGHYHHQQNQQQHHHQHLPHHHQQPQPSQQQTHHQLQHQLQRHTPQQQQQQQQQLQQSNHQQMTAMAAMYAQHYFAQAQQQKQQQQMHRNHPYHHQHHQQQTYSRTPPSALSNSWSHNSPTSYSTTTSPSYNNMSPPQVNRLGIGVPRSYQNNYPPTTPERRRQQQEATSPKNGTFSSTSSPDDNAAANTRKTSKSVDSTGSEGGAGGGGYNDQDEDEDTFAMDL